MPACSVSPASAWMCPRSAAGVEFPPLELPSPPLELLSCCSLRSPALPPELSGAFGAFSIVIGTESAPCESLSPVTLTAACQAPFFLYLCVGVLPAPVVPSPKSHLYVSVSPATLFDAVTLK